MIKALIVTFLMSVIASPAMAEQQHPRPEWVNTPGEPETPGKVPDVLQYPDNSKKPKNQFVKPDRLIRGKFKKGFRVKKITLMKYSDLINEQKKSGGDVVENMQVSPNRQIYVVYIDAPNGVEVPQKGSTTVRYKKSRIRMIFDAETGEKFGTEITEEASAKKP
jgi:hypothetical protein